MPAIGILGTGSYLPKNEIGNEEITSRFDLPADWIERKTLIRYRRFAADHEATSDLAVRAANAALEHAGLEADQIDFLILSTGTGDHLSPPTSSLVQSGIGASRAAAFDLNATCSGFVYGLTVARSLLAASPKARALVVAAEVYSRFTNPDDRATAVLFGDGAGAAVVGAVPSPGGIIDVDLRGYGDEHGLIVIPGGGSRQPASDETVRDHAHTVRMRGPEVTDFVLGHVPGAIHELLQRNGLGVDDVQHFVPHQANGVMVGLLAERAGLAGAHTHMTVQRYGNLGSACIPVTLDDANRAGALCDGDLVLLAGFGSGMTYGSCLLRWSSGEGSDV